MTRPSVTNKGLTAIQEMMAWDPALHLQRVFVYFLQNLYRSAPEGSGIRWNPNEETTEIIISAEKPKLSAIETWPHITCILGAGRWAGTSLDQLQAMRMGGDGMRTHTDLIPLTMAYHCQASDGVTARRLAWISSWMTIALRRLLHKAGGLHHVDPRQEIGPESSPTAFTGPTSKTELVSVVVTVPFYWQFQWRITEPAELWRRVRVELSVMEHPPLERFSIETQYTPDGKPVGRTKVENEPTEALRQVVLESSLDE